MTRSKVSSIAPVIIILSSYHNNNYITYLRYYLERLIVLEVGVLLDQYLQNQG